jgi:outer membrane immunogenic protein
MNKKLLVASILSIAATGAFAQAKNFEGFTAGVNVSSVGASTEVNIAGDSANLGQQNVVPSIELGYNFALGNQFVLGLTGTYDFTKTKGGSLTGNFQTESESHFSINLKPGFVVTPSTMIYATVGYNQMTGKVTGNSITTESQNFTGIGYGLGAAMLVDKNVFIKVEFQQINYGSQSKTIGGEAISYKPNATVGTIGVGYKF